MVDNYPYDYYNIWVKHGDETSYKNEPTLKTLTPLWDVIVFKHCYPASSIKEDENPDTKFIVWTGAALTEKANEQDRAERAHEFFTWVKQEWDTSGDNIYIWDFYELETEGGLYLKDEYAASPTNSHPNKEFSETVASLLCQRVVDVIVNNESKTELTGEYLVESVPDEGIVGE